MPTCFVCQATTPSSTTINGRPVPFCEACLARAIAEAPPACPTCGRRNAVKGHKRRTEAERFADHDQRVLAAVDPDRSWREILRVSKLGTSDAMRARERLMADGRLTLRCDASGRLGARYDENHRKLPGLGFQVTAPSAPAALLPPLK